MEEFIQEAKLMRQEFVNDYRVETDKLAKETNESFKTALKNCMTRNFEQFATAYAEATPAERHTYASLGGELPI